MRNREPHVGNGAFLIGGATPGDNVDALKRDRHVSTRGVDCPECGAVAGDSCVTAEGKSAHRHIARRRMALRAERGES